MFAMHFTHGGQRVPRVSAACRVVASSPAVTAEQAGEVADNEGSKQRARALAALWWLAAAAAASLLLTGCREEPAVMFEPNLVHAMKYQIKDELPMEQTSSDVYWTVSHLFGTPDEPKLPEVATEDPELAELVSVERLMRASGPADAEGRGLYRKHCALCHGITGNGRGSTAGVLNPYPRDYRMGVYKFKSTPRGVKPTREDIVTVIRRGIEGTAMKPIPELTDEDIQALADYVIYLSWRGELERMLIDDAAMELDLEAGERLLPVELVQQLEKDPSLKEKLSKLNEDVEGEELAEYETYRKLERQLQQDDRLKERLEALAKQSEAGEVDLTEEQSEQLESYEVYLEMSESLAEDEELTAKLQQASEQTTAEQLQQFELYTEGWEIVEEYVTDIAGSWLDAEDEVFEVPEPPADLPVAESAEDYQRLRQSDQATALAASVERGQQLFVGKIASCSKCHGEAGLGNGQTDDYDEWTKDWTTRVGLKPEEREKLIPLLARGALPPLNALPRNFAHGVFHGGGSSEDLYRRIVLGIDGTPMPAATFVEGEFEQDDVWHLINFIRSLQKIEDDPALAVSDRKQVE